MGGGRDPRARDAAAGGATSDEQLKAGERTASGARRAADPARQTVFDVGSARLAYLSMWSDAELKTVAAALAKARRGAKFGRVVVVANWGAEHSVAGACETLRPKFDRQAAKSLAAVTNVIGRVDHVVLATPSAMLARRNPGMSYAKAVTLGDALGAQVRSPSPFFLPRRSRRP